MSFIRVNAPKPEGISSGSAKAGKGKVYLALVEDILSWPDRDGKGVKMLGNFTFKPGRSWHHVYMTPSKQDRSWESEGEEDAISITQKFVGVHPGDALESAEFVQQWLGKSVIVAEEFCDGSPINIIGTPCAPLSLQPSFTGNNESTGFTMTFQAYAKTNMLPGYYYGDIVEGAPFEVVDNEALALSEANGTQYLLVEDADADTIAVATNTLDHGTVVSLIGQGGSSPATLATGSGVLLKNGTTWTALENAVINLMVFYDGTTRTLVEQSRA